MTNPARQPLPKPNLSFQDSELADQQVSEHILELLKYDRRWKRNVKLLRTCDSKGWLKVKLDGDNIVACNFETV